MDTPELGADELRDMTSRVVVGADRLHTARLRKRQFVAVGVAVVLVAGVAGAAFGAPLLLPSNVAGPAPTPSVSTPSPSATPTPTPTPLAEPPAFARPQTSEDVLPGVVAGEFDPGSSRFVGEDDAVRFFIARGASAAAPYCLILVPVAGAEGWVAGCGTLEGVGVRGDVVGEARLGAPDSAPAGWVAIDEYVSVNPDAVRTPIVPPAEPEQPDTYTVEDVQASLDAIGPDTASDDAAAHEANSARSAQTTSLAGEAASRLGAKVALIRPTYVGFPNAQTGGMNSLMWMVVTSEPTQFAWSHTHQVNGMDWTGWGVVDNDLATLQNRLSAWLGATYPGEQWVVVTQGG